MTNLEKLTLEKLLEQRKAIDIQIQQLKNQVVVCGDTKFWQIHYPCRPDEWCVSVKTKKIGTGDKERWFSIINAVDKEDAITGLSSLIYDLQGLYDEIKGETE